MERRWIGDAEAIMRTAPPSTVSRVRVAVHFPETEDVASPRAREEGFGHVCSSFHPNHSASSIRRIQAPVFFFQRLFGKPDGDEDAVW